MTYNLRIILRFFENSKPLLWFLVLFTSFSNHSFDVTGFVPTTVLSICLFLVKINEIVFTNNIRGTHRDFFYKNLFLSLNALLFVKKLSLIRVTSYNLIFRHVNQYTFFLKNNYNMYGCFFWYPLFKKSSYYGYSKSVKVLNHFFKN